MPIAASGLSGPQEASANLRLDSWKEIASYLGKGERTAKRWESERALPVHRLPGGGRGSVYAYTAELDEWLRSAKALAGTELEIGLDGADAGADGSVSATTAPEPALPAAGNERPRIGGPDPPVTVPRTLSERQLPTYKPAGTTSSLAGSPCLLESLRQER